MSTPKPPKHLHPPTKKWWASVVGEFELQAHHIRLLTLAAEAHDRCSDARDVIAEQGPYYLNRFSEPRSHPAVAVERDSRLAFARLMRELDLDGAPEPEARPPRIPGR